MQEDIGLQETCINALRRIGPGEDKCDLEIKKELEKGPQKIRVLSREELRMDISKFKNIALRLIEILKQNKIPIPAGLKIDDKIGVKPEAAKKKESDLNADLMGSLDGSMQGDNEEEFLSEDAL